MFENNAEIYGPLYYSDTDSTPQNYDPSEDDYCVASGNAKPTAVVLSSFAARSRAPGPLLLGLAGVTAFAVAGVAWVRRRRSG